MKMRDKIAAAVFLAAILAMCLIPSVGMAVFGPSEPAANEVLAQPPALRDDLGFNFAFPQAAEDYVNDRFFARQELVTAGRRVSAAVFGTAGSDQVLTGRDGWLFYGETLDDYAGVNGLTERELYAAATNLRLMQEDCQRQGIDFLFAIAPNKNSLYPQYMTVPVSGAERDSVKLLRLLEDMGVGTLDLFEVFAARSEPLYFAHDSHWTSQGAALAADAMNEALGRESGFFHGDFAPSAHTGDLFEMLYPAARDRETDMTPVDAPEFTTERGGARPDSITITTESPADGSLLCWRDSFGNALYPYLAASYGQALFSRDPAYDMTLAPRLRADTVIVELVERNIGYLLDYPPVLPAPEREISLPDSVQGELRVCADNAEPEGWAVISADLPVTPDADSPVYVSNGRAVYEAALTRDGFTAFLPAGEGPWLAAFYVKGALTSYSAH